MSDTPEISQNNAPQPPKEDKVPVTPSTDPVFSAEQVREMMKMQMQAINDVLKSETPFQKEDVLNKYEESLRNRVTNNNSQLIRPPESQKPKVNALDYVNSVLDKEKEYRSNMENGRMATQHNTRLQHLNDKIYIMSEFPGNTREEIANVLKDEIEEVV